MTATDSPQLQDKTVRMFGVLVELEFYHEHGEVVSSCFLSIENKDGRFQGSLGLCQDRGAIPYYEGSGADNGPEFYHLTNAQLDAIQDWANENGY